ncbi:hypothetical protein IFR04_012774 [Cadophora malorum]|uniref:Uncharacterized protein n=1 Tax=Cadophora malorum TaxID=108018 RepID=A0A8H7W6G0_9HELO|nr:hypothetical protein IFR04_012774 [Cadophora malorum]
MRRYVQNSGEDSSASEDLGIKIAARNHNSAVDTYRSDMAHSAIVSRSSFITTRDLKIIHAEFQSKIFQAGISRPRPTPPKAGRTLGGTEESTSTADLEQCAWKFIDPNTATAAVRALYRSRDAISTNDTHAASSSSVEEEESEAVVPADKIIRGDVLASPPSYQPS